MMSTTSRAIRNAALALALGGGVVGSSLAWRRYSVIDPYSGLKKVRPHDPSATIQASNVKIRHYERGKLVAQADAKRLTMDENRNGVVLSGIKNGVMETSQGPMQFAAGSGVVRPGIRRVDVSSGVRVKGTDFDIESSTASINGIKGELRVPNPLKGRIQGGDFTATSLIHQPNTEYTYITEPHYKGKIPQSAGEVPAQNANRVWEVKSESAEKKGNVIVYEDARAADGEVIVMAPHIEQNRKTDVIVATGRATYRSAKADMIADKVTIYRKESRAEFSGNVVMLVRAKKDWDKPVPKDDPGLKPLSVELPPDAASQKISPAEKQRDEDLRSGKTLRDYPMNLKADTVSYWYKKGERHAIAKGQDATAYQKFEDGRWWRLVTAPEARYDGEKEMLELIGDVSKFQVHMKNSIGDDFHSTRGMLSTKEDQTEEDEYSKFGKSYGTFADRDSTDDPRGGPATTKPADPKTDPKKIPPPTGGPKKDPS